MVPFCVFCVHQNEHEVEATQKRACQGYVHTQRFTGIVASFRVGGSQDARPSVEFTDDSESSRVNTDSHRNI